MSGVRLTDKQIKQLSNNQIDIREATNQQGQIRYVKCIRLNRIDQLDISQCLEFNRALLGDLEQYIFPQHFLHIQEEITNKTITGLVTEPYTISLEKYVKKERVKEKQALEIFDQVLKAIYSLHVSGFSTKGLRSEHFVISKKTWKLATLIYSNEYSHASGALSEYIWSTRHQPPECFNRQQFKDEEFQPILVWNLGNILLEMLTSNNKLSNFEIMNKFKNQPFSFEAIGMKEHTWKHYSDQLQKVLAYMLHYDPKKRWSLDKVFSLPFLSSEVASHFAKHHPNPVSKIGFGKSSVRINQLSSVNMENLDKINKDLEQKNKKWEQALRVSKGNDFGSEDDFMSGLGEISTRIPNKLNGIKHSEPIKQAEMPEQNKIRLAKCLQTYKSYLDQSQLLIISIQVITQMKFSNKTEQEIKELKLLIKFAVSLVSLVNLYRLSEGFNRNQNILNLPSDDFIFLNETEEFQSLKKLVNFRTSERATLLLELKNSLSMLKAKPLMTHNPFLKDMISSDYKVTTFPKVKAAYRYIVKHAYDQISEQYNQKKKTPEARTLARVAMYVTYCLTTDKLYIKEDIPDNFKFFFQWATIAPSTYVPVSEFKKYLDSASKETLISHSRYILKKYYNI